jgi:tripartite-type tricarboxylate transporter receptor subunit TctC
LTALLSGDVPIMFDTLITSIPLLKAGRLRALGVTLPRRSASLPGVPTIAEAGVRGYEFTAWQSIVVPAGTDKSIVGKIRADVVKTLAMPDVRHKLVDEGANELVGSTPEALARLIRMDIQKYRKLIADSGIRIE